MMKELVGIVSEEEKNQVKKLFERRNSLIELAKIIDDSFPMYERFIDDFRLTSIEFQDWWNIHSSKYQWKNECGAHWEINFETCEIFLVTE